jgi:predicted phage baseplate assembly protein
VTAAWWTREASNARAGRVVRRPGTEVHVPELVGATRDAAVAALRARVSRYTPEWTTARSATDAGQALLWLFAELIEPVLQRLNRLPEKLFVEFLRAANVQPMPPTPASVLLKFEVSDAAPESVVIPRGFQVGGRPRGGGDLVIFETNQTIRATPAKLEEIHVEASRQFLQIDGGTKPDQDFRFPPFGTKPRAGNALYLGFAGDVAPGPTLSLGIRVVEAAGFPPPQPAGGVAPLPVPPPPLLQWDVLDGSTLMPVDVTRDETGGLMRSGVIELRIPERWRPGRPDRMAGSAQRRWLRLRIVSGSYRASPVLSWVLPNVARANQGRTVRDEVLEPLPSGGAPRGAALRLSQTPVLADSVVLEVSESGFDEALSAEPAPDEPLEVPPPATPEVRRWERVDDLAAYGPDAEVFVLDPASGIVQFGDGRNGAALPPGFRHVRALQYRVVAAVTGTLPVGAVSTLLSSAPFVTGVSNPLPAGGGSQEEPPEQTLRRGPEEIRSRGRAVTAADYALMTLRSEGARVERAFGAANVHPSFPGVPIPGVVTVFIVPPIVDVGPPMPTEQELRGVSESLSRALAPLGVEVVAAAPRFRRVRAEARVVVDPAADTAAAIAFVLDRLNTYLHPLRGGTSGEGWPFGATLVYNDLLQQLVSPEKGVRAVPRLTLVVDGLRQAQCADVPIGPHELFWPQQHEVVPEESAA